MNDNEIIKALECCTKGTTSDVCVDCPLRTTDICTEEENGVLKLALDLINRQQAKEKELQEKIVIYKGMIDHQQAEIERLQNLTEKDFEQTAISTVKRHQKWNEYRAIKEFAERLCEGRVSNDPVVIAAKVELKEMVGDTE